MCNTHTHLCVVTHSETLAVYISVPIQCVLFFSCSYYCNSTSYQCKSSFYFECILQVHPVSALVLLCLGSVVTLHIQLQIVVQYVGT